MPHIEDRHPELVEDRIRGLPIGEHQKFDPDIRAAFPYGGSTNQASVLKARESLYGAFTGPAQAPPMSPATIRGQHPAQLPTATDEQRAVYQSSKEAYELRRQGYRVTFDKEKGALDWSRHDEKAEAARLKKFPPPEPVYQRPPTPEEKEEGRRESREARAAEDQEFQRQDRLRQAEERVAKAKTDEEKKSAKTDADQLKAEDAELRRRGSFQSALDEGTAPGVAPEQFQQWNEQRDESSRQRQLWGFWEEQATEAEAWTKDPENAELPEEVWQAKVAQYAEATVAGHKARGAMREAQKQQSAMFDELYGVYRKGQDIADMITGKETPPPEQAQASLEEMAKEIREDPETGERIFLLEYDGGEQWVKENGKPVRD